mmetsp:Transcript_6641/g.18553  ORF Transcript_6641/g.18553 Transcript_6641/m.18553 type:complete len:219 (+) Transcript_6641:2315-2971(+)
MRIEAFILWSVGVTKQRDADIDLLASPLSDIGRQSPKSGMGVDDAIADVIAQGNGATNLGWGDRPIISHSTEKGKRRERRGHLILPQFGQQPLPPEAHVALHPQQIGGETGVGSHRRGFDHPRAVFGHPVASLGSMRVGALLLIEVVHNLLGTKTEADLLVLLVEDEHSVFDLISPEQLVALEVLDAIVRRDELTNARLADVGGILLALLPLFGPSNL